MRTRKVPGGSGRTPGQETRQDGAFQTPVLQVHAGACAGGCTCRRAVSFAVGHGSARKRADTKTGVFASAWGVEEMAPLCRKPLHPPRALLSMPEPGRAHRDHIRTVEPVPDGSAARRAGGDDPRGPSQRIERPRQKESCQEGLHRKVSWFLRRSLRFEHSLRLRLYRACRAFREGKPRAPALKANRFRFGKPPQALRREIDPVHAHGRALLRLFTP